MPARDPLEIVERTDNRSETMPQDNDDKTLSRNLFQPLAWVAALLVVLCYLFGEDESDGWMAAGSSTLLPIASSTDADSNDSRLRRRGTEESYDQRRQQRDSEQYAQRRSPQQRYAQQRYAQQQYAQQLLLRQALLQRMQQQQALQRQSAPSRSCIHRGIGGGTGGDGKTFYAIGRGWSYTGG